MAISWKNFAIVCSIILAIPVMFTIGILVAYGQNQTPEAVTPTPTTAPTPTTPQPNFQYLPQKAYVQPYAPEVGVPANSQPLVPIPTVVPIPQQAVVQQQSSSTAGLDMNGLIGIITGIVSGFGGGFFAKKSADKKAEQIDETTDQIKERQKEAAQIRVEQIAVQKATLQQMYENMPDKGASIQDKPEIRLDNVDKLGKKAVETAAKV